MTATDKIILAHVAFQYMLESLHNLSKDIASLVQMEQMRIQKVVHFPSFIIEELSQ